MVYSKIRISGRSSAFADPMYVTHVHMCPLYRPLSVVRDSEQATMFQRALTPAASELEIDIAGALFDNGSNISSKDGAEQQHPDRQARMASFAAMPDLEESESDDAGFIADTQAEANRKTSHAKVRAVKKGGFQAMGLDVTLLKAISRKGFSVPTPIQRKAIPMILDGQDVVGMARVCVIRPTRKCGLPAESRGDANPWY